MQAATSEVFALDDGGPPSRGAPSERSPLPSSTPGTATPPPEHPHYPNEDLEVQRRTVPLLEFSDDLCSICLDEYTSEDPGAPTVCG